MKLASIGSLKPGAMWQGRALRCWLALGVALVGLNILALNGSWPLGTSGGAPLPIALAPGTPTPVPNVDPTPPTQPVKLVFVEPAGDGWLANVDGALGMALRDNNYFVSSTNETWGPDKTFKIGSFTDIGHWWEWFRGPDSDAYLAALYAESDKNLGGGGNYSRMTNDPGGENQIVILKSDGSNSALGGALADPVPPIDDNPLRGQSDQSDSHTLANAKGIYIDLLNYFRLHPEKLFVVVTAGPLVQDNTSPEEAANARALNTWLVNDWLKNYPLPNVAVFDFFNVLTGDGNHHRYIKTYTSAAIDYTFNQAGNYYAPYYLNVNLHYPDRPGLQKATAEFVPLLNVYYNRWQHGPRAPVPTPTAVSIPSAPGQWGTPTVFPDTGWFPDVAVDSSGKIHLVWSGAILINGKNYDEVVHTVSADGRQWSEATDIMAMESGGEVTRPALLPDPRGVLHMSFRDPYAFYSQAPADQAGQSTAWQAPLQMNHDNWAYFSRMAMDRKGRIHLVYTENTNTSSCSICYQLFYRRSDDGGQSWSQPVSISLLPTGVAKPQILIDNQNDIHIVWEAGRGGTLGHVTDPAQVAYMASYDGGNTWSTPVTFSSPHAHATDSLRNITIGQDGKGNLVIAWLSVVEDQIYFQVSADHGRTWSPAKLVPEIWGGRAVYPSDLDDYAMATDNAGVVHLVLVGRTFLQRSLSVLHLTWNGSAWSKPESIATFRGDVPEWPRLAIGGGNRLYVTWFVRDEAEIYSGGGDYRIWFAQSLSAAHAATPVALPSVTPSPLTPTNTPTPMAAASTATQALTLTPTLSTGKAGPAVYSEPQDLLIVAESVAPIIVILACVAGFVFVARRRR